MHKASVLKGKALELFLALGRAWKEKRVLTAWQLARTANTFCLSTYISELREFIEKYGWIVVCHQSVNKKGQRITRYELYRDTFTYTPMSRLRAMATSGRIK